jgi:predicted DNA-binding transcriptional regulator YafY
MAVTESSARLLALLSLLQMRREWSGADLAARLDVTTRTIRRDIDRLRDLGYTIDATRGTAGYRLGAGTVLPPLQLDDDEAVAVTIGLQTTNAGPEIAEASERALAKLEQSLPSRLRYRLETLQQSVVRAPTRSPAVDPASLIAISDACHRHERLRFDYTDNHATTTRRDAEPHAVVAYSHRWYLVAYDIDRDDWRSFRVDRITPRTPTGPRFVPRRPPAGDFITYLSDQLSVGAWPWQATVTIHQPATEVADRLWTGMGVIEAVDDTHCLLHVGAESPAALGWMITSLNTDFTVTGPPELLDHLAALAHRCLHAITPPPDQDADPAQGA